MKVAKVSWNGVILAESENCLLFDDEYFFPPDSIHTEYLRPSLTETRCPRKGVANHSNVEVNGTVLSDVARSYHNPNPVAQEIKGYVAFGKGAKVEP